MRVIYPLSESELVTVLSAGTSETCVYLLKGWPNHINTDARSGKQLVYTGMYVYIDLRGLVENIQTEE